MRIVLDLQACQTSGSRNRGIGRYSMSLAIAMIRQAHNHEILIVLNNRFPETIESIRRSFDGLIPQEKILVFDVPSPLLEYDPSSTWRCRAAERIREVFLAELSPDIVHVSSLFEGWGDDAVTPIGHFPNRFQTAVTLYDLIPFLYRDTYLADPVSSNLYYRKLQALKNADLLLAISGHSRQEAISALQLAEDQVVNISSAADAMFRRQQISGNEESRLRQRYALTKPFIMYTGGVDYRKNIEGLIEAFSILPEASRLHHQLAIVCKMQDADQQRLQSLAKSFGLAKGEVVFTGFVSDDDLVTLYNIAALFVFPSVHEGFGLPVLEAMSCGVPVIGSNTSSIPEVIGRIDALFNPRRPQEIAAKIEEVITNTAFQNNLRQHGFRQAAQFSWDRSGRTAIDAMEQLHLVSKTRLVSTNAKSTRPRMAYLSPLPPEKSGIARYSTELLPELARYYDIVVIVNQTSVQDTWINSNFPIRSVEWFEAHAERFERTLYHIGNSTLHAHMFDLLERFPGVVILHDFFLSGVLDVLDSQGVVPGAFPRALYDSHGYSALRHAQQAGRLEAIRKYPCNQFVFENATGVIMHSHYSRMMAEQWYGVESARDCRYIPFPKALPFIVDRDKARRQLGLSDTDIVVCSFGLLAPTKLNDRLLETWLASPLAKNLQCRLFFIGENDPNEYGKKLTDTIANANAEGRITITGFVTQELYQAYLSAADIAVQLRANSRGETSAAILDCLSYRIPTIFNANGAAAEIPDEIAIKLPDEFTQQALSNALVKLAFDKDECSTLIKQTGQYMRRLHSLTHVGVQYRDLIEELATESRGARYCSLIRSLASIETPIEPSANDLFSAATSISANQSRMHLPRLFVDVSSLMSSTLSVYSALTARNALVSLLDTNCDKYRVEPIHKMGNQYFFARGFTLNLLGISDIELVDTPVDIKAGDKCIAFELDSCSVELNNQFIQELQNRSCSAYVITLKDLRSEQFTSIGHSEIFNWMMSSAGSAEQLVSISTRQIVGNFDIPDSVRAAKRIPERHMLGIDKSEFVVCLFVVSATSTRSQNAIDLWISSSLQSNNEYRLFLIIDHEDKVCQEALVSKINQYGMNERITIISQHLGDMYHACLAAADLVVQLYDYIKEPEFFSLTECVVYAEKIVVNVNGSSARRIGESMLMLEKEYTNKTSSLNSLKENKADIELEKEFTNLTSIKVPSQSDESENKDLPLLIKDIYKQFIQRGSCGTQAIDIPLVSCPPVAQSSTLRQLLVDISSIHNENITLDIERVISNLLTDLLQCPLAGFRIRLVAAENGHYTYQEISGTDVVDRGHEPIFVRSGDIFLGIGPAVSIEHQYVLADLKLHGIHFLFVVFDLLPIALPSACSFVKHQQFVTWLTTAAKLASGFLCPFSSGVNVLRTWLSESDVKQKELPLIEAFNLIVRPSNKETAQQINPQIKSAHAAFIMATEITNHSCHSQILDVFEELWIRGKKADLILITTQECGDEEFAKRLQEHKQVGQHLFWFNNPPADLLAQLYEVSCAVLLASEHAVYDTRLIETIQIGRPIIARDLPAIREMVGESAFYFIGTDVHNIANELEKYLSFDSHTQLSATTLKINWHYALARSIENVTKSRPKVLDPV
jgi:glycosyltransferase involved in cell wall biosynthesis